MGRMTIKYVNPLGEYDQKFGQRYWGQAHDSNMDISFNLMHPVNFEDGDEIEFEEKTIKEKGQNSKNPGEEYLFLKKVKRLDSGSGTGARATESPVPTIKESGSVPPTTKTAAEPLSYEAGTNARWALKLAVDTYKSVVGGMPDTPQDYNQILKFARWLITSFEALKSGDGETGTGHEKARAIADAIKQRANSVTDVTNDPNYNIPDFPEEK